MNFPFNPSTTQSGSTTSTTAQPVARGFTFEAATTGAGDANKPSVAALLQGTGQHQWTLNGQLFSTNQSNSNIGYPAGFGTTPTTTVPFGTPASGTTGFASFQATTQAAILPPSTAAAAPTGSLGSGTPFGSQSMTLGFRPPAPTSLGTISIPSTLSFNAGATTASSASPFFGAPPPSISTGTGASSFTTPAATAPTTEFTAGTPAASGTTNFSITGAAQSVSSSGTTATANPTSAPSTQGGFSLSGTPTQTAQSTGQSFSLGGTATATPAPATAGFAMATPASSATFSLSSTAPTTAAPAFNLGQTTTALSTTGFSLAKISAAPVSTAAPTSTPQTSLGTATNVTASTAAASQPAGLNFCQLEESINKWTLELEEQEKAFVNQATQVNAWDRLLIANGEKIVTLNQEVERVKLEQQQLEHELDYVVGQQRELQDCLVPLEKELASVSATDPEREYTYRLAENLDTQLKQMSEDLKEIIEHLNEANRSQDSSDPIVQIGKILNAHMNSLQWLDQRTAVLQTKIQQIDQMHQNFRQEHERSFNLAYN